MNLIKSTSTFSFYTLISRILGYCRDLLIAIYLGSGPIADAFFVAFRIPNTFRRLFSEGTFNAAFVPSYSSELALGKKKSQLFANKIFNLLLISLFLIVLIIEIFMPYFVFIIAPGFTENSDKLDLTISLTRITFPFLLFISLSSFFSAILNSHNKFAVAAAAPIILNIFLILTLFFQSYLNDQLVFISLSSFFSAILNSHNKFAVAAAAPIILNILVGTIIASFQASAVSYLYYADRIYQINLAIAGIAIGTVLLPNLSKHIQSKNKIKINFIQNKSLELCLFLSLPATAALLIASEEITSSLFGYGSFNSLSVKNSSIALFYFALGLPAFSMLKIFSNFLFARHNTKMPFYFSVFSVVLNVVISVYFFNKIGFVIIPIATTIASWFNAILLFIYLINKKYFSLEMNLLMSLLKITFSTVLTSFAFFSLIKFFSENLTYEGEYKLITIIFLVILTFIIYILISLVTKAFKISDINLKY